ncbi:cytokine receptor-like factor 2 isoform X1 [Ailuropoda melanoleuca]|uniref:Cytokine receptor-like factor 2 n=1 Tax=Ailuropoda melanoleuca TaxID=9646 RepID=G1LGC7_AILME|nr:cytokine receptor-like factor 2 isoform X1 [Ailuropoda melanoleuca]XP_034505683.1 cytokine receptor-like factor 2 isoform X1 [Ailuropoda melanoleuca]
MSHDGTALLLTLSCVCATMWTACLPWASAALFLLADVIVSEDSAPETALHPQIINFNFEVVQVTWNASKYPGTNLTFLYKLSSDETSSQCSNYILQQSHTAGCFLEAKKDEILCFSIGNGTHLLLTKCQWISAYLKPSSPKDLNFQWHREAITVTCSDLPYKRLLYEIQYKSAFDTEWQSKEGETCNITTDGLDAEKCYFFRARVKTMESSYGPDTYPSDWSEVTHQQRGELRDSCQEKKLFPKFILISGMVALLTVFLLLSLWKVRRVKTLLIPTVPDPKFTFPGLFESHQGNFQEWIKDTQHVAHVHKLEAAEQECVPEDALVVHLVKNEAETPIVTTSSLCPQTEEEEASGDPSQLPCQPTHGGEMVSLGGFMFVMSDNSYITL